MKPQKTKTSSGSPRDKKGPTRRRDIKVNPEAVKLLAKKIRDAGYSEEVVEDDIKTFVRQARKGLI